MKGMSEKSKRRLESKKRKISAFLQVAELNDFEKRQKILEGSEDLEDEAKKKKEKVAGKDFECKFLTANITTTFKGTNVFTDWVLLRELLSNLKSHLKEAMDKL